MPFVSSKSVGNFSMQHGGLLTRAALGFPAERAVLVGRGEDKYYPTSGVIFIYLLTCEPAAVARCARPQSETLNEHCLRKLKKDLKRS